MSVGNEVLVFFDRVSTFLTVVELALDWAIDTSDVAYWNLTAFFCLSVRPPYCLPLIIYHLSFILRCPAFATCYAISYVTPSSRKLMALVH